MTSPLRISPARARRAAVRAQLLCSPRPTEVVETMRLATRKIQLKNSENPSTVSVPPNAAVPVTAIRS